jgi:hypothetical protein
MFFQRTSIKKTLLAIVTTKWFLPCMYCNMSFQRLSCPKTLLAIVTAKLFLPCMNYFVVYQKFFSFEGLLTVVTGVRLLPCKIDMIFKMVLAREGFCMCCIIFRPETNNRFCIMFENSTLKLTYAAVGSPLIYNRKTRKCPSYLHNTGRASYFWTTFKPL